MANPQLENGYIKIANEIMGELAKIRIPGQARQVLDFILRKTYGWNKKTDVISLSQFVKGTKLSKVAICKGLNKLLEMNLITKKGNAKSHFTKKGNDFDITYGFQKEYRQWRTLPKKVMLLKKVKDVTQKGNRTLPKKVTPPLKDTITKYSQNSKEFRLSVLLLNFILKRNPKYKKPNIQNWAKHINYAIRIDKRTPEELKKVIKWCQQDNFWQNNILSTEKLRKQFDILWLKMNEGNENNSDEYDPFEGCIEI